MEPIEMKQPNAIVFRLPDDDEGNKVFAEVMLKPDGTLEPEAQAFGVDNEDAFNELEYSTVVLVLKESEETSLEVASFDILDKGSVGGEPVQVWQILGELDGVVPGLIESYNNGAGRTIQ